MFFVHSMKNIARSKGKSVLFFVLIAALTLILALGVSVWSSVENFLDDCEEAYTTIGLVEYMGENYPETSVYDADAAGVLDSFDISALTESEHVKLWDSSARALGYVDGYTRRDNQMIDNSLGVIVVSNIDNAAYDDNICYGTVLKVLYSFEEHENHYVFFSDLDFVTERSGYYLMIGRFYSSRSYDYFEPLGAQDLDSGWLGGADLSGVEPILKISKTADGFEIPEVYRTIADTFYTLNNSVEVVATDDVDSLLEFNQLYAYVEEGRVFTDEEYQSGQQVCIVSSRLASVCNKSLGDEIDLSFVIKGGVDLANTYYAGNGFTNSGRYRIVGITNDSADYTWCVYIPKADGIAWDEMTVGYTLGQVVIDNDHAVEYYESVKDLLPNRVIMTVYDQGYSSVAKPLQAILRVAKIVSVVCGVAAFAMLLLFGFLFVFRQREASLTMLALGTAKGQVLAYFMMGSGAIALAASALGALGGLLLSGVMSDFIAWLASLYEVTDSRYSVGALTSSLGVTFSSETDFVLFAAVAAAVFVTAMLFCAFFALGTFIESRPRKKRSGPNRERRSSTAFGGRPIKYSVLSVLRSGARSVVVPILALAVVLFFGQLVGTADRYEAELNEIKAATDIDGKFTDVHGKQISGLALDAYHINDLYNSGYIDKLGVSYQIDYRYMGTPVHANGAKEYVPDISYPTGEFAFESFVNEFLSGPDVVFTNDLRRTGEFYYSENIEFKFLDGYGEDVFTQQCAELPCAIVPTSFMRDNGVELGDTIRLAFRCVSPNFVGSEFAHVNMLVVGCFEKQLSAENIYCQLDAWLDITLFGRENDEAYTPGNTVAVLTGTVIPEHRGPVYIETTVKEWLSSHTLRSCAFSVPDAFSYVGFKDFLSEYGFSSVIRMGSVREFVVLDDQTFNETVTTLEQQIIYINILYPLLYLLVGVVGMVVSYLLIIGRRKEFAVMRGIGAGKSRTFFTFFWEQAFLCILGCALGLGAWYIYDGAFAALHMILIGGFAACYFVGCAVSVGIMNNSAVLSILSAED